MPPETPQDLPPVRPLTPDEEREQQAKTVAYRLAYVVAGAAALLLVASLLGLSFRLFCYFAGI